MMLNIPLLLLLLSMLLYGFVLFILFKLKRKIKAPGVHMMFYGFIAMFVITILINLFMHEESRMLIWAESLTNSISLLIFSIGFYKFSKWFISTDFPQKN